MSKIKTNYLAGKYKLTKYVYPLNNPTDRREDTINLTLTSTQAKCLFTNQLYQKFGFDEMEYVGD